MVTPSFQEKYLLENLPNGLYYVNSERIITYWNKAATRILGHTADEAVGVSCRSLLGGLVLGTDSLCDVLCPLAQKIENFDEWQGKKLVSVVTQLSHKDGHSIPLQICCFPLFDEDLRIRGSAVFLEPLAPYEDMTRRFLELEHIAYQDVLTEIPNRRYLEERLREWVTDWHQKKWRFAVVMADIDFFKKVNDTYGHDAGDVVLKQMAATLRGSLRTSDLVGRWGGEEFLILMRNISSEKLYQRLESMRRKIEASVLGPSDVPLRLTMSFGGVLSRPEESVSSILARVDACLYRSKTTGRNRVTLDVEEG